MHKINKIMVIAFILLLALASFVAPQWLSSTAFMFIYLFFALLILVSVFMIPDIFIKMLHFLMAVFIICFVLIKVGNHRESFTFAEGESYALIADGDSINFKLIDFNIVKSNDDIKTENFVSKVNVNGKNAEISVNHPFAYKRSRFYQSGYGTVESFLFCTKNDTIELYGGQSKTLAGSELIFHEYDERIGKVAVSIDRQLHLIPLKDRTQNIFIVPDGFAQASIIDYVEVKGHVIMYIIGVLSIIMLIFVRFKGI